MQKHGRNASLAKVELGIDLKEKSLGGVSQRRLNSTIKFYLPLNFAHFYNWGGRYDG